MTQKLTESPKPYLTPYKETEHKTEQHIEMEETKKQNSMSQKGKTFFSPTVLMSSINN